MVFLSLIIYLITSFVVGVILVGLSLNILTLEKLSYCLKNTILVDPFTQITGGWIGVLIILSSITLIAKFMRGVRREKAINIQTSEGTIIIRLSAIEDMVKKTLEEQHEISHVKPRVSITRRGINILVRGYLEAEINLVEFTSSMQSEIRKRVEHILGREREIKINLEIKKLAFSPKKEVIEEEPEVPFRHYQ